MPTEHKRLELRGGLSVNTVLDPKFKTNMINVRFLCEHDRGKSAAYALIPQILTSTNADCPDSALMNRRLNALYGAWMGGSSRQMGDIYELSMSISCLCDRYALDGEQISVDSAKLLLDCILSPALENGGFLISEFNTKKLDLLNQIDSEINDKLSYALNHAFNIAYRGEPSADRFFGTRDDVEALTPERAYEVYRDILNTARIEISFCGAGPFDETEKLFTEALARPEAVYAAPKYFAPSLCKETPEYGEINLDVQQADLILIFKTNGADHRAVTVLSYLYGETPLSKLFLNVREKLSLCYFCSSAYIETKGVLYVVSGVAPENIKLAKDEIIRQLEAIKAGDFTDDDLLAAKLSLSNAYRSVGDKVNRLDEWYHTQVLKGTKDDPEDKLRKLYEVTRGEIIAAAEKIKLDTVFVLKNKETE